ncbi:MAG: NAD(P)-binding domain-containing protein [Nitrospira sp.]|nr:NAD(P)-binding domain-containing protein [Nitrospira sp.]MCP9462539.1 NAD(P)-binding domain-containing protein [Nitrospira sp.]MCP9475343.1 NAD(P)-binding domain-containing protein [Nitrospira sp.]
MSFLNVSLLYLLPVLAAAAWHVRRRRQREVEDRARLEETRKANIPEPITLHPVIDPNKCLGSGACVRACPEHSLGIVNGKAVLVAPEHCIGHGACEAACPFGAISLVFGTEKRGIDIPYVKPTFETNVPGIFIAGELGGMGLIRKGVEQGVRAMETIRKNRASGGELDVVIVGAGPAGLAGSLAAKEAGLRFVTVEQEVGLGGCIFHYPRRKLTMTSPMKWPIVGLFDKREISKEELLEFLNGAVKKTGLEIRFSERMEAITKEDGGFIVRTSKASYRAANVLLAIGRRGTPRKLGVPGEEQPKVVYSLIDPEQYRGQHVLVVGGGDSAAEAALAIANEPGTVVSVSSRGEEIFTRPKEKNRRLLKELVDRGAVTVYLNANVQQIGQDSVTIEEKGNAVTIKNDAVIVCIGGTLPTPMLKEIGIMVDTYYGTPIAR